MIDSIHDWHRQNIKNLLQKIPNHVSYQLYYRHQENVDFDSILIQQPNFIFVNFDILERNEYDHTHGNPVPFVEKFLKFVDQHPQTKFILIHHIENVEQTLVHPRLDLVRIGSGLSREVDAYQTLDPELAKNFDSKKIFICLNRSPRQHRINLASYLLGLNFEQHGTMSFDKKNARAPSWLERCSWNLTEQQIEQVKPLLMRGYEKLRNLDLYQSIDHVDQIYNQSIDQQKRGVDSKNFDLSLRHLYKNHFVEIISETQFNLPFFGASEKFRNSVFGCVFPIMIGGAGLVKFLQDLGFDMFEDIIDHSYDSIQDPLDRLCASIDLNYLLLSDSDRTKKLWIKNQNRFINNIDFIKNQMLDKLQRRAHNDFDKVIWNVDT